MKRGSPVRKPTIACCLFSVSSAMATCLSKKDGRVDYRTGMQVVLFAPIRDK